MSFQNTGRTKHTTSLGQWNAQGFQFHSRGHETEWLKQAYRQSVDPKAWQTANPVDARTQMLLEAMPEKSANQFFRGPDGKHRVLGPEQRESKEVTEHRRKNVGPWLNSLPNKMQTTWSNLADLPDDHAHPGEAEQVAKWMGTYDALNKEIPPTRIAKGPVPRLTPTIPDIAPLDALPANPPTGGGRRGVVAGASGLPPAPKQPTRQGEALENTASASSDEILMPKPGSSDSFFKTPPVLNFNTPKTRPYPPMPTVLDVSQSAPALGLKAERMQSMPWMALDQQLRAQDTYNPLENTIPIRLQPLRSHQRSPLAAAQEALDIAHETHLAKGRDWNQELPLHPEVADAEFDNALEASVTEATNLWTGRKDGIPTAVEIEQIRQYIAPRLAGYFPENTREDLLKTDIPSSALPQIKDGTQRISDLMSALTFGEIKEITVDGQKIALSEIGVQPEMAAEAKKRPGSHGSAVVQRFNYLIGQEVKELLKDCEETIETAEIVNGPKSPMADGSGFESFVENSLQDPSRRGTKGSMRSDIAIRLIYNGQDCIFHINSVDMKDTYTPTDREAANFNRGIENAKAIFQFYDMAAGRWAQRVQKMTLSQRNALAMIPKPTTDDEAEFQRVLKEFVNRLDCASIVAECESGAGYLDTLPNEGATVE